MTESITVVAEDGIIRRDTLYTIVYSVVGCIRDTEGPGRIANLVCMGYGSLKVKHYLMFMHVVDTKTQSHLATNTLMNAKYVGKYGWLLKFAILSLVYAFRCLSRWNPGFYF